LLECRIETLLDLLRLADDPQLYGAGVQVFARYLHELGDSTRVYRLREFEAPAVLSVRFALGEVSRGDLNERSESSSVCRVRPQRLAEEIG
jgi:hypothetical protein